MTLQKSDLRNLVYDTFEIDSFQSKMGEDKDIITVSFSLREKDAANDLMNFLEKGYGFILDADITPGEQSDGTYKVFVELERNNQIADNLLEIVDGVTKLSDLDRIKFRYYKNFKSHEVTAENIVKYVPMDSTTYEQITNETKLENYKHFFNKSYLEEIDLLENTLTVKKPYGDRIQFTVIDICNKEELTEIVTESFDVNSWPEIIFLTKYLGDYNISKYGDKIVIENDNKALILKRG